MDMLVERACAIVSNEPIHVYVNPTFIPDQLMPDYDVLWTPGRMQKVIDACVKSGVAIEINNRYRIPSETFLKMAKNSGAKFTFGTNNTSPGDVGKLDYCIEMIKACGLTPDDMFIPVSRNI
jgi:histidinol phosphatase-like PHP family hydrolase